VSALPGSVEEIAAQSGTRIRMLDGQTEEGRAALEFLRDADRAMRYLGLPDWEVALVECTDGIVALAHAGGETRAAIVTANAGVPLGSVQRVTHRVRAELEEL
jgi:hypothetical protein